MYLLIGFHLNINEMGALACSLWSLKKKKNLQRLHVHVALELQSKYSHDKNIQTWKSSWFYSISEYFTPSPNASRYFRSLIGLIDSKLFCINVHQTPLLSCFPIVLYGRKPYRTIGIEIKKNLEGIWAFSGKYINVHTPSRKRSSISHFKNVLFFTEHCSSRLRHSW